MSEDKVKEYICCSHKAVKYYCSKVTRKDNP